MTEPEWWRRGQVFMSQAANDISSFEQAVLRRLRSNEGERFHSYGSEITVKEVRLEGAHPDTHIALIMSDDQRPACRFGWKRALWDVGMFADWGTDPEKHAFIDGEHFAEDVMAQGYGLPPRCLPDPDWITWMGQHEVELDEAARRAPFEVLLPSAPPTDDAPLILYDWGTLGGYRPEAVILRYVLPGGRLCEITQAAWAHNYLRSITWQLDYRSGQVLFRGTSEMGEPAIKTMLLRGDAVIWLRSELTVEELMDIALSLVPLGSENLGS